MDKVNKSNTHSPTTCTENSPVISLSDNCDEQAHTHPADSDKVIHLLVGASIPLSCWMMETSFHPSTLPLWNSLSLSL